MKAGHDPARAERGIRLVAMDHDGCGQRCDAEVERVKALAETLLGTKFTSRDGRTAKIGWEHILLVAPYNMQVHALAAPLPPTARIGAVNNIQDRCDERGEGEECVGMCINRWD